MFALVFVSVLQNIATGAFIAACIDSSTLRCDWPEAAILVLSNFAFVYYVTKESSGDGIPPESGDAADSADMLRMLTRART